MSEIEKIEDQLRRAFAGEAWYGNSLLENLDNVAAEIAAARPLKRFHSIWEIVLHLIFTEEIVVRRLRGQAAEFDEGEDWLVINDASEAAWQSVLEKLKLNHQNLLQIIEQFDEKQLNNKVVGRDYTIYFLLHGLVQHLTYHAGQIAVLKKAIQRKE